jgi:hypothetical protein
MQIFFILVFVISELEILGQTNALSGSVRSQAFDAGERLCFPTNSEDAVKDARHRAGDFPSLRRESGS